MKNNFGVPREKTRRWGKSGSRRAVLAADFIIFKQPSRFGGCLHRVRFAVLGCDLQLLGAAAAAVGRHVGVLDGRRQHDVAVCARQRRRVQRQRALQRQLGLDVQVHGRLVHRAARRQIVVARVVQTVQAARHGRDSDGHLGVRRGRRRRRWRRRRRHRRRRQRRQTALHGARQQNAAVVDRLLVVQLVVLAVCVGTPRETRLVAVTVHQSVRARACKRAHAKG